MSCKRDLKESPRGSVRGRVLSTKGAQEGKSLQTLVFPFGGGYYILFLHVEHLCQNPHLLGGDHRRAKKSLLAHRGRAAWLYLGHYYQHAAVGILCGAV